MSTLPPSVAEEARTRLPWGAEEARTLLPSGAEEAVAASHRRPGAAAARNLRLTVEAGVAGSLPLAAAAASPTSDDLLMPL
ncbi:MAG: hypothetical protein ACYDB4_03850 [Candidatus Dormibacteraceae bacterium]